MSCSLSKLEELANIVDSLHKTPAYTATGYPMVRVTDVKYGYLDLSKTLRVAENTFQEFSRRYKPGNGDIIVTRVGTYGIFSKVMETNFCLGQNTAAIVPKNINADYLYAALNSSYVRAQVEASVVGSTQKTLSLRLIGKLDIPRLGEKYEAEIANFSSTLDTRIALLRETNSTLEKIAQALFKSWFIDFDPVRTKSYSSHIKGLDDETASLFPNSFVQSELGEIPQGWKLGTLADLTTFQNGYAFKGQDWTSSGHPVIKIGNVKPRLISFDGCSFVSQKTTLGLDRFKLDRGDLLVGMTGYVGETGLVPEVNPAAYLNQRVGKFSTRQGIQDIGFVYCLVRNEMFKSFAESQSHGSAQANVSGADLLKLPTVIPDSKLLSSFNSILFPIIDAIISNYEKEQTLISLRDPLLGRLISGQLKLPDAEEQIEAAKV